MTRAALMGVLLAAAACESITGSFDEVIAVEIAGAASRRIQEGTTLQLQAAALDLNGDTVDATILWAIIDTVPGFTLDTATGLVTAMTPGGPWRVQARVGTLRTSPVAITVAGAPDSAAPFGDTVLTATAGGTSPQMTVKVFDLTTVPGTSPGLGQVPVRFVVAEPLGAGIVLRSVTQVDSLAVPDSVTISTQVSGQASAVLRATGTVPDSVIVHATVTTAGGGAVPGSPVRFIVRFQ